MVTSVIVLFVVGVNFSHAYAEVNRGRHFGVYHSAVALVDDMDLRECSIMSNGYVHLNYLGLLVQNTPRDKQLAARIEDGERILLFKNINEPVYVQDASFLSQFPTLYEDDDIVVLGVSEISCNVARENTRPYMYRVDDAIFETKGVHTPTDPCVFLSFNSDVVKGICRLVNFKNPFD